MSRILYIEPNSEAEKYFIELTKYCEDCVLVRCRDIFGDSSCNEYEITENDFMRIKAVIEAD